MTKNSIHEAYTALMKGISVLDLNGPNVSSDLVLIGHNAFPLVINARGQVLMAASFYGDGRVVVLGHESYLTTFPALVENALMWLAGSPCQSTTVVVHQSCKALADTMSNSRLQPKVGCFCKDNGVYVTDAYSVGSEVKELVEFLKVTKGGLLIAGQAWSWACKHRDLNTLLDFPANKVSSVAGIYFSDRPGVLGTLSVPPQIPSSWLSVAIGKDFKDDLEFLLKGVSEFDIRGESIPSEVLVHGPLAFPIGATPDGRAFLAGAYYGQGRVIVVTHEGYVGREQLSPFWINAIRWLDKGRNGPVGISSGIAFSFPLLSKSGVPCERSGFRTDLSVYVCTSYSDNQVDEIQDFVAEGGGLLIGGHAWCWAHTHPGQNPMTDYAGNRILNKMGLSLLKETLGAGCFKAPVMGRKCSEGIAKDFKDDLEFLLKGVSEFDIRGESVPSVVLVHGPLAFPIGATPDGRAFLAGAYYGQGRVIVVTHEGYVGREQFSPFWINAVHWLDKGRNGPVGISSGIAFSFPLLCQSGVPCERSGFRKDLSVYVCTSYSDKQVDEIQNFVAEGGGLLIGGHAWWWAHTHPGQNPMTDYAGNRILNKMGLSLLVKTLGASARQCLKAPVMGRNCSEGYHFRHMLHRFAGHMTTGEKLTEQEESRLKKLVNDCSSFLQMRAHDCASYTSVVAMLTEVLKKTGIPQVGHNCPVSNAKDHLLLNVGAEVYKVSKNPDDLLPYLMKDLTVKPIWPNHRILISCNEAGGEQWLSTGAYLSPGMKSNMSLPSEIVGKGWKVQIGCQTDNIGNASELKRAPVVHERFPIDTQIMQVWNLWGGLLYLIAPPNTQVDGLEIIIEQVVLVPYFKSGVTTPAEWENLRNAPSPWAEFEFENIIITLSSDLVRGVDRPHLVAEVWDDIMRGIADLAAIPAKFPRKERFVVDVQISHGYMHAGYPIMMQPDEAWKLLDPRAMRNSGHWGPIHELGHNQQRGVWEFPHHTTECTCNLWSMYVHEEVLGINRDRAHPNMTLANRQCRVKEYVKGGRNLSAWTVWVALETYMQLQEQFGWDAFKKVFAAYHTMQNVPNDNPGKMNLYAETFSLTVMKNLAPFFKAWPIEPATEQKLSHLPVWSDHPMAKYN
ncbi:hypothetical protein UPYG_G00194610 [Umbra pygmaea]|uniref:Peptidase M60 domain-containing protein n=1 Tax=Umbra pygmaea TaxID=75934 RepID=A0ABD0WIJ1_UMBPY